MDYHKTWLEFSPGANQGDLLTTVRAYEARGVQGWGLCWYFAAELAERFYISHGIEPRTILLEGTGFLGMRLIQHPCPGVNGRGAVLGKLTLDGLAENWLSGGTGSDWHEEDLPNMCAEARLMYLMDVLPVPMFSDAHQADCLHRRNGAAYCLMFRLAALFSMRHDVDSGWSVINEKSALRDLAQKHDPKYDDGDETTYFLFRGKHDLLVSGDSRIILPGPLDEYDDFWVRYMLGQSASDILDIIEYAVTSGTIEYTGGPIAQQEPEETAEEAKDETAEETAVEFVEETVQGPDMDPAFLSFVQRNHAEDSYDWWNRKLMEAASWRLACELYRRFPAQFRLLEYHPGGGQYDCLGLISREVTININRQGRMHIWDDNHENLTEPLPIWQAMMKTGNYHHLLDDVCALARLTKPGSMPPTSPTTLVYRFIAAFLSHAVFGVQHWECRQGYLETAGYGGGTMEQYFAPFPWAKAQIHPLPENRELDNADEFWFLLCDGKPKLVLHISGWAARPRAKKGVELMPLYHKHGRKVWPVVMAVAGELLP